MDLHEILERLKSLRVGWSQSLRMNHGLEYDYKRYLEAINKYEEKKAEYDLRKRSWRPRFPFFAESKLKEPERPQFTSNRTNNIQEWYEGYQKTFASVLTEPLHSSITRHDINVFKLQQAVEALISFGSDASFDTQPLELALGALSEEAEKLIQVQAKYDAAGNIRMSAIEDAGIVIETIVDPHLLLQNIEESVLTVSARIDAALSTPGLVLTSGLADLDKHSPKST